MLTPAKYLGADSFPNFESEASDGPPLYHHGDIKVEYHPPSRGHVLTITHNPYFLPNGSLEEMARSHTGELFDKIQGIDGMAWFDLYETGVDANVFHIAICQAYIEEKLRYIESIGK